jgi:hypothetical protein
MKSCQKFLQVALAVVAFGGLLQTNSMAQIVLGPNNVLTNTTDSSIAGGNFNTNSGNSYSTVGGGFQNHMAGTYGVIGGGLMNFVSTNYGVVGGGFDNFATTGAYATVGGGSGNTASGTASTIPGGFGGSASHYGQLAHASGVFTNSGDAQASQFVLRGISSSTNLTELFLDGLSARMTIPNNTVWAFDILVGANSATNTAGGFKASGVIKNSGGNVIMLGGSLNVPAIVSDVASWKVTASADTVNKALAVKVTGDATNVRWVATVRTSEVSR